MSTTASPISPSNTSDSNQYVVPHTGNDSNPRQTALDAGIARSTYQHNLVQVSRGKIGGGKNKNKKSKKYSRKSVIKKKFTKKFRRSILRKKSRRMRLHKKNKKISHGGGDKLTIPSFQQTSPAGSDIINKLATNNAQTLAYSKYDSEVSKPPSS